MRALVTGGSGFLGRHLVADLESRGAEVLSLSSRTCDLTQPANLDRLPDVAFDRIYHLAAWTRAGDFCVHHKGEQWLTNQLINTNVLRYWRDHQPRALLLAVGTSCAYPADSPLQESSYLLGEPADPDLRVYAMTKRMLFLGLMAMREQFGMSYAHVVPSTLYGPGFAPGDNHFVFDLVRKIVRGKRLGEPVVLWGDGSQVRELLHVRDAVSLIEIGAGLAPNTVLNVGDGRGRTIRDYAVLICDIVGFDPGRIQYDPDAYVGVPTKVLRVDRLRALTSFAFTDLRRGLEEVVRDYEGSLLGTEGKAGASSERRARTTRQNPVASQKS